MTIVRAERLPGQGQDGFVKADIEGYGHSTNVFGTMLDNDFVEWDLTDTDRPILNQRMTFEANNLSFARAFPTRYLGTLFGKAFDVFGWNQSPRLVDVATNPSLGDRGTTFDQAPAVDLNEVTLLVGFPAPISDLPNVVVKIDSDVASSGLYNNVLVDMYANRTINLPPDYISDGDPLNDNIQPPFSKHLNVQLQLDHGRERPNHNTAHAWGYSGATVMGETTIDGQTYRYAHKQETLGGNNFPFISFCGWNGSSYVRVTEVNITNIWNWVVANWNTILAEAAAVGVSYGDVTRQSLLASHCDGVHAGSEILGGGIGSIVFQELSIEITDSSAGGGATGGGSTPIGGGGGSGSGLTTIAVTAPTTDAEFAQWRADRTNDPHRIFLAEMDHSNGTILYGSRAWLSMDDDHLSYDDAIPEGSTPFLESSVSNIITVGDLTAVNIDGQDIDLLSLEFFGFRSRWLYGDDRWRRIEFRRIATSTIQACRLVGPNTYQFDLLSDTSKYNQPFIGSEERFTGTAEEVLLGVFDAANSNEGSEVGTFEIVGDVDLSVDFEITANENTTLDSVIRTACTSLNARRRISQSGALQIVSRLQVDTPQFEFFEDVIDGDSIRMVSTRSPAAFVRVTYNDGNDFVDVETLASINGLLTTVTINTYLTNQSDAIALGEVEAGRYRQALNVWQMDVLNNLEQNSIVDQGIISHPSVSGFGEITRVRRKPLTEVTTVEVEI